MVSGRTVVHALVGAIVGVVLSFIPFSTVLGGAVAGFLEGPDGRRGAAAGALSGAIAFVPIAGLFLLVLAILGFGVSAAAVPLEGVALAAVAMAVASMIALLYTVGLSIVGGYLGAYLARQYPEHHASTRRSIAGRREPRVRGTRGARGAHRERHDPRAARPDDDRREPRDHRDRREPRDDPRDSADAFSPDPHERLDPTRWHEDRDGESASESDAEREHPRDRERERERNRDE